MTRGQVAIWSVSFVLVSCASALRLSGGTFARPSGMSVSDERGIVYGSVSEVVVIEGYDGVALPGVGVLRLVGSECSMFSSSSLGLHMFYGSDCLPDMDVEGRSLCFDNLEMSDAWTHRKLVVSGCSEFTSVDVDDALKAGRFPHGRITLHWLLATERIVLHSYDLLEAWAGGRTAQ